MFCIVRATREQLESIGCSRDLTGKVVDYIADYKTGYSLIRTDPPDYIIKALVDRAIKKVMISQRNG